MNYFLIAAVAWLPVDGEVGIDPSLCRCPDNDFTGIYYEVDLAGFPKLNQDPDEFTEPPGVPEDEDPEDDSVLRRNARAQDGYAFASIFCKADNTWTTGVASAGGSCFATFEAEQRWQWVPALSSMPPIPGGTELAASYSISGSQYVKGVTGPAGTLFFTDPAACASAATYGALFDLTCWQKDERAHALIRGAQNVEGAAIHLGLSAEWGKEKKGVGGQITSDRVFGTPSYDKETPIVGGGVLNLRTSATTIIVKRAGAAVASVAAYGDGSWAKAWAKTELTITFNAPVFTWCNAYGGTGPIDPIEDDMFP